MPSVGTYGDDRRRQQWICTELIPRHLMPPADVPTPQWVISEGGRGVRVVGSYDAIWYATRIDSALRDAIEAGDRDASIEVDLGVVVTLVVS